MAHAIKYDRRDDMMKDWITGRPAEWAVVMSLSLQRLILQQNERFRLGMNFLGLLTIKPAIKFERKSTFRYNEFMGPQINLYNMTPCSKNALMNRFLDDIIDVYHGQNIFDSEHLQICCIPIYRWCGR